MPKFVFSHNDVSETALQVKNRRAGAIELSKEEFIAYVGKKAFCDLLLALGEPEACFKNEDCIYASVQSIDYVFIMETANV